MMHGYIFMMIACQLIMIDLFDFNDYVMPKLDKVMICLNYLSLNAYMFHDCVKYIHDE